MHKTVNMCSMWRLAGRCASNEVAARLQKVAEKKFGEHVSALMRPANAAMRQAELQLLLLYYTHMPLRLGLLAFITSPRLFV